MDQLEIIRLIICWVLLAVFSFTAIATALSLVGIVKFVHATQQARLFQLLIVEVVVAAVAAFAGALTFRPSTVANQLLQQGETRAITALATSSNLRSARLLWVDDNPDNNLDERAVLSRSGATIVKAENTAGAIAELRDAVFDVIITDSSRSDDPQAAYTLVHQLRSHGISLPVIIYSGSSTPVAAAQAKAEGAYGQTNRPSELFRMINEAIAQNPSHGA